MENVQPLAQEVSTLELLWQIYNKMEEILVSIEGRFLETFILEKLITKEFEGLTSTVNLVQYLWNLTVYTMSIWNKMD